MRRSKSQKRQRERCQAFRVSGFPVPVDFPEGSSLWADLRFPKTGRNRPAMAAQMVGTLGRRGGGHRIQGRSLFLERSGGVSRRP